MGRGRRACCTPSPGAFSVLLTSSPPASPTNTRAADSACAFPLRDRRAFRSVYAYPAVCSTWTFNSSPAACLPYYLQLRTTCTLTLHPISLPGESTQQGRRACLLYGIFSKPLLDRCLGSYSTLPPPSPCPHPTMPRCTPHHPCPRTYHTAPLCTHLAGAMRGGKQA